MGIVGDRLDNLRVETSSPDGQVTGVLRPPSELAIAFSYDRYRHYTERDLEHQLSVLVEQLWTEYREARLAAVVEATGRSAGEDTPWDANSRRYRAERDESRYEGMSNGRSVFVRSTGLLRWRFVIRDGALHALGEAALAADVASGYAALMRDCHQKLNRLRDKHFPR